jgi:hypothetical protein
VNDCFANAKFNLFCANLNISSFPFRLSPSNLAFHDNQYESFSSSVSFSGHLLLPRRLIFDFKIRGKQSSSSNLVDDQLRKQNREFIQYANLAIPIRQSPGFIPHGFPLKELNVPKIKCIEEEVINNTDFLNE